MSVSPAFPLVPLPLAADRYLEAVAPQCTPDEIDREIRLVGDFVQGPGGAVQSRLQRALDRGTNLLDHWAREAYLADRRPLTEASSYGIVFVPLGVAHETPSAFIAGSYAAAIAEAARASRVGQVDDRVVATLGSARVPGPVRDSVQVDPGANHVVLAVGGDFWRVDVIDAGGSPVPFPVLVHQIHAIVVQCRERRRHRDPVPVGAATSLDRDSWCALREAIRTRSRRNRENLEAIESALVLISLDDTDIGSVLQGIDWCWGGQPANRWRDKGLQIIVTPAGRLALQVEHTTVDGAGIALLHDFLVPRDLCPSRVTAGQAAPADAHPANPHRMGPDRQARATIA